MRGAGRSKVVVAVRGLELQGASGELQAGRGAAGRQGSCRGAAVGLGLES